MEKQDKRKKRSRSRKTSPDKSKESSEVSVSTSEEIHTSASEEEHEEDIGNSNIRKILTHQIAQGTKKYLIKLGDKSYRNCQWMTEKEILQYKNGKASLRNYEKEYPTDPPEKPWYDPSYEIPEKILTIEEIEKNKLKILVKWTNLDYDNCTWETEKSLNDPELIKAYKKSNQVPSLIERFIPPHPHASKFKTILSYPPSKNGLNVKSYQLEALNFFANRWYHQKNVILADEDGLGKTLQAAIFLEYLSKKCKIHGPFLVIVPLSEIPHWEEELAEWTELRVLIYYGSNIRRKLTREHEFFYKSTSYPKFELLLTTFEYILKESELFKKIFWRYIILDESNNLKTQEAKLFNILLSFNVDYKMLITGTPLKTNLEELKFLLHYIDKVSYEDLSKFQQKFGELTETDQVIELQSILKPLMIRRLKSDVENSHAPLEEIIFECPMSKHQKTYYKSIYTKNMGFLTKGAIQQQSINLRNITMELRKVCNHPYLIKGAEEKILVERRELANIDVDDALPTDFEDESLIKSSGKMILFDKLLTMLKKDKHRVLVLSQMIKMLDIIQEYLINKKYNFRRVDGAVRGDIRQESIDDFNQDNEIFVFLLCTKAGDQNINLTADTVVIFDSDLNPQNDILATSCINGIGQNIEVKAYRFITANSYERKMYDRAIVQSNLITSNEQAEKISNEEMEKLLRLGAYYSYEEDEQSEKIDKEDIESLIFRSSKIKHKSVLSEKGSTYSASQFEIEEDETIDITNQDFWLKYQPEIVEEEEIPVSTISEKRKMIDEGKDESNEEGEDGKHKKFEWSRNKITKLFNAFLKFGWGRWKKIYENAELDCSAEELKNACRVMLKWLLEASDENYPVVQTIYEKSYDISQLKEQEKFSRQYRREYAPIITNGASWKVGRIDSLHFLHLIVTTCPFPPNEIIVPDSSTCKPTQWWTQKDDQALLYSCWEDGYMTNINDVKFSHDITEVINFQRSVTVRFKKIIEELKDSYKKFKEQSGEEVLFNHETLKKALVEMWNKRDQYALVNYLITHGYTTPEDIQEKILHSKTTKSIENVVNAIYNYCTLFLDKGEKDQGMLPEGISGKQSLKIMRRKEIFDKIRDNNFLAEVPKEDRVIYEYVAEHGFEDLEFSDHIVKRFGNLDLIVHVNSFLKENLLKNSRYQNSTKLSKLHRSNAKCFSSMPNIPTNPDGSVIFPYQVTQKAILISIGEIRAEKPFYNNRYIYPVGYTIDRSFMSYSNPTIHEWYRCTVEEKDNEPVFKIFPRSNPEIEFVGSSPSKPWMKLLQRIELSKKKYGVAPNRNMAISGPEYYGFSWSNIIYLIQQLPGADQCVDYVFKVFGEGGEEEEEEEAELPKTRSQGRRRKELEITIEEEEENETYDENGMRRNPPRKSTKRKIYEDTEDTEETYEDDGGEFEFENNEEAVNAEEEDSKEKLIEKGKNTITDNKIEDEKENITEETNDNITEEPKDDAIKEVQQNVEEEANADPDEFEIFQLDF